MAISKGKSTKPSKIVKPKQQRKRTETDRQFRFQSFSERISKLKIDPIRRHRVNEAREELADDRGSYFNRSLQRWRDTNLSQGFIQFVREVAPLCDNLPLVLHNQDQIMNALDEHIQKLDVYAAEPLLALLADFARDLDVRFEAHFERAVRTVTSVAAQHVELTAIEWCFNCLAWLFKYLSRLLVPDLRPVYNLMSSYLGKKSQKPFLIRFAAESMSYLIRKAAASYDRDEEPLNAILRHIMEDVDRSIDEKGSDLYQQGIMTLLSESVKGIQGAIHSSAPAILQVCWQQCSNSRFEARTAICRGVLTTMIHSSYGRGFAPVVDLILNAAEATDLTDDPAVSFAVEMIFTIATVRKGSRINDWSRVHKCLNKFITTDSCRSWRVETRDQIVSALVSAIAYGSRSVDSAPVQSLQAMQSACWEPHFRQFCDYVARIDPANFERLVLPRMQQYLSSTLLPKNELLGWLGLLPRILTTRYECTIILLPESQEMIVKELQHTVDEHVDREEKFIAQEILLFDALQFLKLTPDSRRDFASSLVSIIRQGLDPNCTHMKLRQCAAGPCLQAWLGLEASPDQLQEVFARMCQGAKELQTMPSYWSNLRSLIATDGLDCSAMDDIQDIMIDALSSPSKLIREAVLEIEKSYLSHKDEEIPQVLLTALLIESTPISLDTSRTISLNIRKLGVEYSDVASDAFFSRAIATYCLGLLHWRLSQAWSDATATLAEIARTPAGEEYVMKMAELWLENNVETETETERSELILADTPKYHVLSDFECPNLTRLSAMRQQIFREANSGYPTATQLVEDATAQVSAIPLGSRGQALRVLDTLHQIAEKRSRLLVPKFLLWTAADAENAVEDPESTRWNRKDQKALLGVFAKFQNPRVLYRSSEVYNTVLRLCSNGDVEIQKAALQALCAWKQAAVVRYQEQLTNLLDDARIREVLSVFLQREDESGMREDDLPTVMPILLRLLYGKLVGGSKERQPARRKAVFVALSRYSDVYLTAFINIALASAGDVTFMDDSGFLPSSIEHFKMPLRQQVGMLNMIGDMLATLGSGLQPVASKILNAVLGCTIIAQHRLDECSDTADTSLLRSVRQNGSECLVKLFAAIETPELVTRSELISKELLIPRSASFAIGNTQNISSSLRLISVFASNIHYLPALFYGNAVLLHTLADILGQPETQVEFKLFILVEIVQKLYSEVALPLIPEAATKQFVAHMAKVLQSGSSKELLAACITSLVQLAKTVQESEQAQQILDVCKFLLVQSGKLVANRTKTDLLRSMMPLLAVPGVEIDSELHMALSGLFSRFEDTDSREVLAQVLEIVSKGHADREEAAEICRMLNCMSTSRLGEADHEQRELGFFRIYERAAAFTSEHWPPILHNCLYFVSDGEDTVNRASAAKALQVLVTTSTADDEVMSLFKSQLFPAIRKGMTAKSEFVRAEHLKLLGTMITTHSTWDEVSDMQSLTLEVDDEASFFTNVLHIQQHRRLRALKRLGEQSTVRSTNIMRIFLPLLEQFIFDPAEGDSGRTLADQSIHTIGLLSKRMKWSDSKKTFQRYAGFLKTKPDFQKIVLRLLGAIVDGIDESIHRSQELLPELDHLSKNSSSSVSAGEQSTVRGSERKILPQNRVKVVTDDFLPPLLKFLHLKDESNVDRRVAVAISAVKLLRLLPEEEFVLRLAPLLTDVSHILRSRDWEAREQCRRTLSTILTLVGSAYLGFLLKELRGALQRGYQLHVLSYTVHYLLVTAGASFQIGEMDDCVPELIAVILDDIFGVTGQEKDAEEYKSTVKEVKASKSYDTIEILARTTSITRLGQLLLPIRALLQEKLDGSTVNKIDNLLIRIRRGVDLNPEADSQNALVFCHELVRQVYHQRNLSAQEAGLQDWKLKKYLHRATPGQSQLKNATTSYLFKLTAFALGLVRKIVHRHEGLRTPSNMAGFLPMLGDGLVSGEQEIKIESAKLLSAIIGLRLPELDQNAATYLGEAIAMVKSSSSTVTDTARAGLELATAVLRERRDVVFRENDIAAMLRAIKADLDEPDRHGQIFRFLRAVLGRKMVITEVYEVMDEVGKIMVSNQDEGVRQNARAAYVTFVIDFPQANARWKNTTSFLIKNLSYQHPGGRRSILEATHTLLGKLDDGLVQSLLLGLFVALVQRVVGETDSSCKEGATLLLSRVFKLAHAEQLAQMKSMTSKWLRTDDNPGVRQAAIASWTSLARLDMINDKELSTLLNAVENCIDTTSSSSDKLRIMALDLLLQLSESHPARTFRQDFATILPPIEKLLAQQEGETPIRAAKLIEILFDNIASNMAKSGQSLAAAELRSIGGLALDMPDLCRICLLHLRGLRLVQSSDIELCTKVVRNLVFVGRVFAANGKDWCATSEPGSNGHESGEDGSDDSSEEGEAESLTDGHASPEKDHSALGYLASRLAYTIRREDAPVLGRISALRAAMTLMHLPNVMLPNIHMFIKALYILTDPATGRPTGEMHRTLTDLAREFMNATQNVLGAEAYIKLLTAAKKEVDERRQERQRKRKIDAVSNPERWLKEKQRKHALQKANLKAKTQLKRERSRYY